MIKSKNQTNQSEPKRAPRLTPKQDIFATKYIEKLNGAAAARAAGYSPKIAEVIASQNIRKHNVQMAIKERMRAVGFDESFISDRLKRIVEAGTTDRALSKATPKDANVALRSGAELYGLLSNKTIDNRTLILKAELSNKSLAELKEELKRIRSEEAKYLKA